MSNFVPNDKKRFSTRDGQWIDTLYKNQKRRDYRDEEKD